MTDREFWQAAFVAFLRHGVSLPKGFAKTHYVSPVHADPVRCAEFADAALKELRARFGVENARMIFELQKDCAG